ncbi:hypothetical protein [Methylorubrum aminovorans]|uniref:hypothetical protein n=1 Tax=Methylorubrum aminovorans TaxID=269069 RepID=UPI003C2FEFFF
MSRRLYVTLCIVLFAAVMLALRALLHATVPGATEWAASKVDIRAMLVLLFSVFVIIGVWSYRGHRRQGSSRRR